MTLRVLFVTEKWPGAYPGTGESATIQHLISTFQEWASGEAFVIWTDDAYHSRIDVRQLIKAAAAEFKPHLTVYTPIPNQHLEPQNVAPDAMQDAGGKTVCVFFDLADETARSVSRKYADAADLCVMIDGDTRPIGKKSLSLWAATVRRPQQNKPIPVSFIGSRKSFSDRLSGLAALEGAGIPVLVRGGRHEDQLTFVDYFHLLGASAITLNFSRNPAGARQIKARVFEAMASGCCLIEDQNEVTAKFFEPGREYLDWRSADELVDVVLRMMRSPTERAAIAEAGRRRFERDYSSSAFWSKIVGEFYPSYLPRITFNFGVDVEP